MVESMKSILAQIRAEGVVDTKNGDISDQHTRMRYCILGRYCEYLGIGRIKREARGILHDARMVLENWSMFMATS